MWLLTYTVCLSVLFFEGANRIVAGAKLQQDKIRSNYFHPTKCEADTIHRNFKPTLDNSEASDAASEKSGQSFNEENDPAEKSGNATQYFGQPFSELRLAERYTTEEFTRTEREYGVQLNSHNDSKMHNRIKSEMATTFLQSSDDEDGIGIKQDPVVGLEEESEEPEETLSHTSPIPISEDDFKDNQLYTDRTTESNIGLEDETECSIDRKQVQKLVPESNANKLEEGYDESSVTHTVNIELMFKPVVTPGILSQLPVLDENIATRKTKEELVASDSEKVPDRPQKQSNEKHRHPLHERMRFAPKSTAKHHKTMFTGRKGLLVSSGRPNNSPRALHKGKGKAWLTTCNLLNQPMDDTAVTQKWNSKALATSEHMIENNIFETTEAGTFPVYVTKETEGILSNLYISSYAITGIPTYTVQENSDGEKSSQGNVPECYKISGSTQKSIETANNPISIQGNVQNSSGISQANLSIANEQVTTQGNFISTEISIVTNQQSIENIDGQISKKVNFPNGDKNDDTDQKDIGNVNGQIINQGKDPVRETTEGIASDNNSPEFQNRRAYPNKKPEPIPDRRSDNDGQNSAQVEVKIKVGFGPGSSTIKYSTCQVSRPRPRTRSRLTSYKTRGPTTCKPTHSTTCKNILDEQADLLKCLYNSTTCAASTTTAFNINQFLCPSTQNNQGLSPPTNVAALVLNTRTPSSKDDTRSSTEPWYWCCFKKVMTTVKIKDSSSKMTVAAQEKAVANLKEENSHSSSSVEPECHESNTAQNQTDASNNTKSSTMGMLPGTSSTGKTNMSTDVRAIYQQTCPYLSTSLSQEEKNQGSNIVAPASNGQENLSNGEGSSHTASTKLMSLTARRTSMPPLPTTPITDKQTVESSTLVTIRPQDLQYVSLITLSTPQYVTYSSRKQVSNTPQATLSSRKTGKLSHTLKQKLQEAMKYVTQPIQAESENLSHTTTNFIMDVKMVDHPPSQSASPLISPPNAPPEIHKKLSGFIGNQFQNNIIGNEIGILETKKSYDYLFSTNDVKYVNSDHILTTLKYEEEIKTLLQNGNVKNPSIHEPADEGRLKGDNYNRASERELSHIQDGKNSFRSLEDQETKDSESKEGNQWIANIMTKNQKEPVRVRVKFIYDPTAEKAFNSDE